MHINRTISLHQRLEHRTKTRGHPLCCFTVNREKKKPYGITLITCNQTLVYIIDYLLDLVSGNFDVKIEHHKMLFRW